MKTTSKMPRLEDFPGFVVRKGSTLSSFNPFEELSQGRVLTFGEDEVKNDEGEETPSNTKNKKQFLVENVLDAPKPKARLEQEVNEKGALDAIDDNIESRSEERRVGKECSKQCRSRWSPYH